MYRIIFEHHPKKGQEKEFIAQWQKGSDVIQTYPGARGTALFRKAGESSIFYEMSDWYSKEARAEAMEAMKLKHPDAGKVLHGHEEYLESHTVLGEFESLAESHPPVSKWK